MFYNRLFFDENKIRFFEVICNRISHNLALKQIVVEVNLKETAEKNEFSEVFLYNSFCK